MGIAEVIGGECHDPWSQDGSPECQGSFASHQVSPA